ncbi:MAG: ABC transporter permease [Anaerolineales bacterium]
MKMIWLVAKTTYRQRIRSWTFLFLTFGLPLIMVVAGAVPVLTEFRGDIPVIGYVDQTAQMADLEEIKVEGETASLISYPTQEFAKKGFQQGEVGGYLIIPENYFQGGAPMYYGENEPNTKIEAALEKLVRVGFLSDTPSWAVERVQTPANITFIAQKTGQRVSEGPALILRVGTPIFLALVFILTIFTGATQMGSVVVLEKDQRAMEVVVTSISPTELVSGKVLGMTLLSLTQVGVWIIAAVLAVLLLFLDDLAGHALSIPWGSLLWAALLGIPGYFLFALVGAGLGIIAGDAEQARQLAGMLGFVGLAPMYFLGVIVKALDGPLAVGLTLFPFTAPTIGLFRLALTDVPLWQLGGSFLTLMVCLGISVWFVSRIFRATMLMYGQKLKPQEIFRAFSELRSAG